MHKGLLKEQIKKKYGKIALVEVNHSDSCCSCMQNEFDTSSTPNSNIILNSRENLSNEIGYQEKELQSLPKESILGLGCCAPLNFGVKKR